MVDSRQMVIAYFEEEDSADFGDDYSDTLTKARAIAALPDILERIAEIVKLDPDELAGIRVMELGELIDSLSAPLPEAV